VRVPVLFRSRTARQEAGSRGEDAALAHLLRHGLQLVERNFLCKGGELDLIMQDGATLVFVEVRQRTAAISAVLPPASRLPSSVA